jgi:hypothetical protein
VDLSPASDSSDSLDDSLLLILDGPPFEPVESLCDGIVLAVKAKNRERGKGNINGRVASSCDDFLTVHSLLSAISEPSSTVIETTYTHTAMAISVLSPAERDFVITGLAQSPPSRLDGRDLLTPRPISISYAEAPQASGSSRVLIGGTQVVAGIRLEVGDVDPSAPKGREGWRGKVEVDVYVKLKDIVGILLMVRTPQAYPAMSSSNLSTLSTQFANAISEHFMPSVPAIPILAPTK